MERKRTRIRKDNSGSSSSLQKQKRKQRTHQQNSRKHVKVFCVEKKKKLLRDRFGDGSPCNGTEAKCIGISYEAAAPSPCFYLVPTTVGGTSPTHTSHVKNDGYAFLNFSTPLIRPELQRKSEKVRATTNARPLCRGQKLVKGDSTGGKTPTTTLGSTSRCNLLECGRSGVRRAGRLRGLWEMPRTVGHSGGPGGVQNARRTANRRVRARRCTSENVGKSEMSGRSRSLTGGKCLLVCTSVSVRVCVCVVTTVETGGKMDGTNVESVMLYCVMWCHVVLCWFASHLDRQATDEHANGDRLRKRHVKDKI